MLAMLINALKERYPATRAIILTMIFAPLIAAVIYLLIFGVE